MLDLILIVLKCTFNLEVLILLSDEIFPQGYLIQKNSVTPTFTIENAI